MLEKKEHGEAWSRDHADDVDRSDDEWHRCVACSARVALVRDRVDVFGAHEHVFMNPSGLLFAIACFAAAPGSRAVGEPSDEWSWFPKFVWTIVVCARCRAHLGWRFDSRAESRPFFGLIRERIDRE